MSQEARRSRLRRLLFEGQISDEEYAKMVLRMKTPSRADVLYTLRGWDHVQGSVEALEAQIIEFVANQRRPDLRLKFKRTFQNLISLPPVVFLRPGDFLEFQKQARQNNWKVQVNAFSSDKAFTCWRRMREGLEASPEDLQYPCLKAVQGPVEVSSGEPNYLVLKRFPWLERYNPRYLVAQDHWP